MVDKKLPSGSSDRARRINSLHHQVDGMIQEQDKKRLQVSAEINSLTKEQQKLMQQLDMERSEFTTDTAAAYDGVVRNLGKTIQNLSIGVKNITTDTAKATAGAINQYGKAIGEDISVNKQNTMVMALAKATPLFGYFAAKFMETDVFQSSAKKIKDQVTGTLSSAGESLGNVFKKKQSQDMGAALPPKLQEGGFIKKGGMIEVHAAEVVTPVDKLLDRIDPAGGEKVIEKLSAIHAELKIAGREGSETQQELLKSTNELRAAMIGSADRIQIGWQKTILENPAFRAMTTFSQLMDTVVKAPFKAIFGIRGGYLGDVRRATRTSNIYQQQVNVLALIYTKGMTFLRNIQKYTKVTAEALVGEEVSPTSSKTYTLFGRIKEFMTTRKIKGMGENAFDRFAKDLNLDKGALKEAGITSFTDLLAPGKILRNFGLGKQNVMGKLREGPDGTMFSKTEEAAKNVKRRYSKTALGRKTSGMYARGKGVADETGQWAKQKGDFVKEKTTNIWEVGKGKGESAWRTTKTLPGRLVDELSRIRKAEEEREEREGPHSPSMAENIAATAYVSTKKASKYYSLASNRIISMWRTAKRKAKAAKKHLKREYKTEETKQKKIAEIEKAARKTSRSVDAAAKTAKKNRKDVKGWIPFIFSIISGIVSKLGSIGKKIGTIAMFLLGPSYKLAKKGVVSVGKLFGKGTGNIAKRAGTRAARTAGGARGAMAGGGVRGLGKYALKGGAKVAGAAAGGVVGGLIGGGTALWDMAQAMMHGDEIGFVGGFITRGLAGFLGGTDSGVGGMASGAMKGGGIGSAIGLAGGLPGVALGGAIGTVVGGVLGFLGGANISKGIKESMSGLGDVLGVIWKIVKFPFQIIREVSKSIWYVLKHISVSIYKKIKDWVSNIPILNDFVLGFKIIVKGIGNAFKALFTKIAGFFKGKGKNSFIETLKKNMMAVMFPIATLLKVNKWIAHKINGWLSNLPVIGKAYKWLKRSTKSIQSGDLSESLKRALDDKPQIVTDKQRDNLSAKDIAQLYADEEAVRIKAAEELARKQTESMNKNADKNTQSRNQVTVATTNVNTSTSITNGGGGQSQFPSVGAKYTTGSQTLSDSIAAGRI